MNAPDGELPSSGDEEAHTSGSRAPERRSLPAIGSGDDRQLPVVSADYGDSSNHTQPGQAVEVAPGAVVRVVMEQPAPTTYVVPRSMQWSLRQLIEVLLVMALLCGGGLVAGALYGRGAEPVYAARSEFIYFLEDAVPDGFLREDRRILTQLVTLESEAVVAPVAREFGTTVEDVRDAMSVEVLDLSEVIRLDVQDPDGARALAMNEAILGNYRDVAEITDRRDDNSVLLDRRKDVLKELAIADQAALDIASAEIDDVALLSQEESLQRQLDSAIARVDRLASLSDNTLAAPVVTDDRATLESQLASSRQSLATLEQQLLVVRTERTQMQLAIEQQLGTGVPEAATPYRERDAQLSVQEDSLELEIDTTAERIRQLEGLLAQSRLNQTGAVDTTSIGTELAAAQTEVTGLEQELVDVRTQRAELTRRSAQLPSLTRTINRLETELIDLDAQITQANTTAAAPSPIEVLTEPLLLSEPVGNPTIRWAALGFIAALPFAALAGALVRQRQRKQR